MKALDPATPEPHFNLGVNRTPGIFINGYGYDSEADFELLFAALEQ